MSDREEALDYATRAAERAAAGWRTPTRSTCSPGRARCCRRATRAGRLALKRAVAYQGLFHAIMDGAPIRGLNPDLLRRDLADDLETR